MLYLIGGPARCGKTLLARRLHRRLQAPYFVTDYLTSGLAGEPSLGVRHELGNRERGERAWPVLEGLLRNVAEVEPCYVVEGDLLLPERLASFQSRFDGQVRACFLGYPSCNPDVKVAAIRSHPSPVNDWVAGMSDARLHDLVAEMIEFSRYLETECERRRLPFFDGSHDFERTLEQAETHLVAEARA